MMEEKDNSIYSCGVLPVESRRAGRGPGSPPRRSPPKRAGGSSSSACGVRSREKEVNTTDHKQDKLTILQWNAKGIQKKKEALKVFLYQQKVDIACIQESHLNSNLRFSIRGYTCYRQDRDNQPKGGVITLVKNDIPSTDINISPSSDTEFLGTKLLLPEGNISLFNCYCPPDRKLDLDRMQLSNDEENIIVGDMNSHSQSWGYPDLNTRGEEIEEWQGENRLILLNKPDDKPSFYSRTWLTSTTPDIAFATNNISKGSKREVLDQLATSDHRPIIITIKRKHSPCNNSLYPRWNYKKANWDLFKKLTDTYAAQINCKTNKINTSYSALSKAILRAAKESIPKGARQNYIPNWSEHLQELHDTAAEARNMVENMPTIENNIQLNAANAPYQKEYLKAIRKSWHEKTEGLNCDKDGHKLWDIAKCLNQEENRSVQIVLEVDNKEKTGKEAAQELMTNFKNAGSINISKERSKEVNDEILRNEQSDPPPQHECMIKSLTKKEFEDALKTLKPKQAPGPDKITNAMLTHLGPKTKKKLLQLFNASWKMGKF